MSALVYTAPWRLMRDVPPGVVVPVKTSVGGPRFIPGASRFPAIKELMPLGLLDVGEPEEFTRLYRRRLDEHGVARIQARFDKLHKRHPGQPLATSLEYGRDGGEPVQIEGRELVIAVERAR